MKWIRASEKVPDHYNSVFARYTVNGALCKWTIRYNPSCQQWITHGAERLIEATDLEWLDEADESPSLTAADETKLQEEAEASAKEATKPLTVLPSEQWQMYLEGHIEGFKEGRRRSIARKREKDAEIEALKGEVAELRERLDRLVIENRSLSEELAVYRMEK